MNRKALIYPAVLLASAGMVAGQLLFAGTSGAVPNAADTTFAAGNEQVNLAEMTIGAIALQRSTSPAAKALASQTMADHRSAQAKLKPVAAALKLVLPTAPNAQQQSQAAQLRSVDAADFDATYLQIQLAGHQLSIAATQNEISSGSDPGMLSYAKGYLPVAQMHLSMTEQDLTALGLPSGVPAGTGGQAGTGQRSEVPLASGLAVLAVLLVGSGLVVLVRRPRRSPVSGLR